ncbi:hypothetical protein V6N11_003030 [Hibiscus sabdariffa]|uniref:Uncharacterized protein n=1 Tax=Hibiscus sabdariffa TaxID=183260 RepID=A0ABR2SC24_9ROSI
MLLGCSLLYFCILGQFPKAQIQGLLFSDRFSSSLVWLLPVLRFIHLFSLSFYSAISLDLFFNNHFRIESKINKMPWSFVNRARLVVFFLVILLISIEFERKFNSFNLVPLATGNFWVGGVRMYISVTIKRYRAIKEVGKIKMSVGVIAYYKLVQVCQAEYFRQLLKPVT